MALDPNQGFELSLLIALTIGAIVAIALATISLRGYIRDVAEDRMDIAIFVIILSVLPPLYGSAVAAALFCAIFSILNPLLQTNLISFASIEQDLTAGTLTLRIVSVVLIIKLGTLMLHIFSSGESGMSPWFRPKHFTSGEERDILSDLRTADGEREVARLHLKAHLRCGQVDSLRFTQHGFFLSVLTFLWISTIQSDRPTATVLLSFALLFIVDDWVIVSDYVALLGGRLLDHHRRRIDAANLLIAPIAVWGAFTSLSTRYAVLASVVILGLLFIRYVTTYLTPSRLNRILEWSERQ